ALSPYRSRSRSRGDRHFRLASILFLLTIRLAITRRRTGSTSGLSRLSGSHSSNSSSRPGRLATTDSSIDQRRAHRPAFPSSAERVPSSAGSIPVFVRLRVTAHTARVAVRAKVSVILIVLLAEVHRLNVLQFAWSWRRQSYASSLSQYTPLTSRQSFQF